MITLIVARARNGAIGRDGGIPWHAPEDLRMFQRETLGSALVMGRHTWDSLPVKPLGHRMNCVVSRDTALAEHVFPSVEAAITAGYAAGHTRISAMGGVRIYAATLPLAHRLLITEVDLDVPDADAFLPAFDEGAWIEIRRTVLRGAGPACTLRELVRH